MLSLLLKKQIFYFCYPLLSNKASTFWRTKLFFWRTLCSSFLKKQSLTFKMTPKVTFCEMNFPTFLLLFFILLYCLGYFATFFCSFLYKPRLWPYILSPKQRGTCMAAIPKAEVSIIIGNEKKVYNFQIRSLVWLENSDPFLLTDTYFVLVSSLQWIFFINFSYPGRTQQSCGLLRHVWDREVEGSKLPVLDPSG